MKAALPVFAAFMVLAAPVWASSGGEEKKDAAEEVEASIGLRGKIMDPSKAVHDAVSGITLNITQFSYPGVPERAACRTVIRVENDSEHTINMYTLLRTFDREKNPLGTWMTPTGNLAPGQSGEKLYSCKLARYMILDEGSAEGWPNACKIDGSERSPCPIRLKLDVNIDPLPPPPPPKGEKGKESKDEKPAAKH